MSKASSLPAIARLTEENDELQRANRSLTVRLQTLAGDYEDPESS